MARLPCPNGQLKARSTYAPAPTPASHRKNPSRHQPTTKAHWGHHGQGIVPTPLTKPIALRIFPPSHRRQRGGAAKTSLSERCCKVLENKGTSSTVTLFPSRSPVTGSCPRNDDATVNDKQHSPAQDPRIHGGHRESHSRHRLLRPPAIAPCVGRTRSA